MPVVIKWFPPSWLQIKGEGLILYIDPAYLRTYFADYAQRIEFSKWPDPIDGLPEELEPADIILVTHHHKDHVKRPTVNRLRRPDTTILAPERCVKELGAVATGALVSPGKNFNLRGVGIRAVDAYNTASGSSTRKTHHRGEGVGYVVTVGGKTIYHAGDTDYISEMRELGPIDAAFLPIGGAFTMNLEEAIDAALTIRPKVVVPIHRFKADPGEFKRRLEANSDIQVAPLRIGEAVCLS